MSASSGRIDVSRRVDLPRIPRQRFLDAAFELIDEKGTTDFTIQEVIERSKQSLRAFYEYFDGKNELVLALFEETLREAHDDIRQAGSLTMVTSETAINTVSGEHVCTALNTLVERGA